jgi:hypothetical protein
MPVQYRKLWDKGGAIDGCVRKWCHYVKAKHGIAINDSAQVLSWGTAPTSNPQFMLAFNWVRPDINMSCTGILEGAVECFLPIPAPHARTCKPEEPDYLCRKLHWLLPRSGWALHSSFWFKLVFILPLHFRVSNVKSTSPSPPTAFSASQATPA